MTSTSLEKYTRLKIIILKQRLTRCILPQRGQEDGGGISEPLQVVAGGSIRVVQDAGEVELCIEAYAGVQLEGQVPREAGEGQDCSGWNSG